MGGNVDKSGQVDVERLRALVCVLIVLFVVLSLNPKLRPIEMCSPVIECVLWL